MRGFPWAARTVLRTLRVKVCLFSKVEESLPGRDRTVAGTWFVSEAFYRGSALDKANLDLNLETLCDRLPELDGRFALLSATKQGVIAATDALGCGSIYYAERNDTFWVSSHLGPLLASLEGSVSLDPVGTVGVLASLGPVAGLTPFQDIHRLKTGELIQSKYLDPRAAGPATEIRRYFNLGSWASSLGEETISPFDRDELFTSILQRQIQLRATDSTPVISLSGGRDSRALLMASLGCKDIDASTYSFGDPKALDPRIGRMVAGHFGVRNQSQPDFDWDFSTFAQEIISVAGGTSSLRNGYLLAGYSNAPGNRLMFSGFLGDALTGGHFPATAYPDAVAAQSLVLAQTGRADSRFDGVFAIELDQIRELVYQSYSALEPLPDHHKFQLVDLTQRQAGWINGLNEVSDVFTDMRCPFASKEVIAFFLSIPYEELVAQKFYDNWSRHQFREHRVATPAAFIWSTLGPHTAARLSKNALRLLGNRRDIDWQSRLERSRGFFEDALRMWSVDERLGEFCAEELSQPFGRRAPISLHGLAILGALAQSRRQQDLTEVSDQL